MADPDLIALTLSAEASRALRQAVADGEYGSVDEAVADALAQWGNRHEDRAEHLAWVKARILRARLDPSPDLTEEKLDARLNAFFAAAEKEADEAA